MLIIYIRKRLLPKLPLKLLLKIILIHRAM
jgi:hypothetical protein